MANNSFARARVVSIVDGATIDVAVNGDVVRVRYLGIEVPSAGSEGTPVGERALDFNRFLVEGRTVELDKGTADIDEFGRLLRYVYVDGEMVNTTLLTNGYATVAAFPPDFKYRTEFAIAEESARRAGRGYWSPLPPGARPDESTPAPRQPFHGGTFPLPPGAGDEVVVCDFSKTAQPVIKGNVESKSGERVYYAPGNLLYSTVEVSEQDGDAWFCTEEEAAEAGWKRSKH